MFTAEIYAQRRAELCRRVGDGLILLPGNVEAPFNYPNNTYAFRQDSTFLYYFGQNVPSLVGVIDASTGEATLYGDDFTVEDIIWMGPQATIEDLALQVGVAKSKPMAALAADLQIAITLGRRVHYLPPYRGLTKLQLSDLLGIKPEMLHARKSWDLIFAVAEMREKGSGGRCNRTQHNGSRQRQHLGECKMQTDQHRIHQKGSHHGLDNTNGNGFGTHVFQLTEAEFIAHGKSNKA